MISFWLRKLSKSLFYFLLISQAFFALWSFLPSDFVDVALKDASTEEERSLWKQELGLSGSVLSRWINLQNNIYSKAGGTSWSFNRPVISVIADRVSGSFFLALWSVLLSITVTLSLSLYASNKEVLSRILKKAAAVSLGFPIIVIGPAVILIFGVLFFKMELLSTSLFFPPILAIFLLSWAQIINAFPLFLETATSLWSRPFVLGLRARGISDADIKRKHLLKNLVPLLSTQMAQWASSVISGAIIIEVLFEIPGLGRLFQEALLSRDLPLVHGLILCFSVIYVLCFFLADLGTQFFYKGRES